MIEAINALKIATITPTLNAWPAASKADAHDSQQRVKGGPL